MNTPKFQHTLLFLALIPPAAHVGNQQWLLRDRPK